MDRITIFIVFFIIIVSGLTFNHIIVKQNLFKTETTQYCKNDKTLPLTYNDQIKLKYFIGSNKFCFIGSYGDSDLMKLFKKNNFKIIKITNTELLLLKTKPNYITIEFSHKINKYHYLGDFFTVKINPLLNKIILTNHYFYKINTKNKILYALELRDWNSNDKNILANRLENEGYSIFNENDLTLAQKNNPNIDFLVLSEKEGSL